MNLRTSSTLAPELIDAMLEGYVSWREESAAVESAYQRWSAPGCEDHALAFALYISALDREEHAADRYRLLTQQVAGG